MRKSARDNCLPADPPSDLKNPYEIALSGIKWREKNMYRARIRRQRRCSRLLKSLVLHGVSWNYMGETGERNLADVLLGYSVFSLSLSLSLCRLSLVHALRIGGPAPAAESRRGTPKAEANRQPKGNERHCCLFRKTRARNQLLAFRKLINAIDWRTSPVVIFFASFAARN